jgi:hypothetical protein
VDRHVLAIELLDAAKRYHCRAAMGQRLRTTTFQASAGSTW